MSTMTSTMSSINGTLVGINQQIQAQVNSSANLIANARKTVSDLQSSVKSGTDSVDAGDASRNLAVLLLLLLPLFSVVAVVLGGLLRMGFIFSINYLLGYLICMLMFLLFMVHLPIAVVLADVCYYVNQYDADLRNRCVCCRCSSDCRDV